MIKHIGSAAAAAGVLVGAVLGCSERARSGAVALRLSSGRMTPQGDSAVVALGRDSIIVRNVRLVLKEIQLAPAGSGECDPEEEEEECALLAAGPVLLGLPLGDSTQPMLAVQAPADTYIVFHFAIYTPTRNQDSAFLAAHPDVAGSSIRVEGSFVQAGKRRPFVYASDFNEQQETALQPPLTVPPGATAQLTLRMDIATWFLDAHKDALIDPASANPGGPNEHLVEDNIRTSVAAFRADTARGLPATAAAGYPPAPSGAAVSPWPVDAATHQLAGLLSRGPASAPSCRRDAPRITPDSIGPLRLDQSLAELQRACPRLLYGWEVDPDGFPVPAVATRLGGVIVTALFTDTLSIATVRQVDLERVGLKTAEGVGVTSTLRDLERVYGTPGASEAGCVLRVWFASLPGLAFRMAFPARERRECGGLSEEPLPPDLRVAALILVPR
jgi:hypothetical protein